VSVTFVTLVAELPLVSGNVTSGGKVEQFDVPVVVACNSASGGRGMEEMSNKLFVTEVVIVNELWRKPSQH